VKRLALIASPEIGRRLEEKIGRRSYYGYRIVRRFDYPDAGDKGSSLLDSVAEFIRRMRSMMSFSLPAMP
jgi:hypothetical protein